MNQTRKQAIMAGSSLVLMAVVAGFAFGYAFPFFKEMTDRSLFPTLRGLFYFMIAAFGVIALLDVIVAVKFSQLFQSVNRKQASMQLLLRLVYTAFLVTSLVVLLTTKKDGSNLSVNIRYFQMIWMSGMVVFGLHH